MMSRNFYPPFSCFMLVVLYDVTTRRTFEMPSKAFFIGDRTAIRILLHTDGLSYKRPCVALIAPYKLIRLKYSSGRSTLRPCAFYKGEHLLLIDKTSKK